VVEDDNRSLNFRDNLSNLASNVSAQRTYVVRKSAKGRSQISQMGVKGLAPVTGLHKLNRDASPYRMNPVEADPQYLDIVCVNCNESIPYYSVDLHSQECSKVHFN
jgi:hypothetical protein